MKIRMAERTNHYLDLILGLFFIIIGSINAENVRQKLFGLNDVCNFRQYPLNKVCVSRNELCNGRNDYEDYSDEEHCYKNEGDLSPGFLFESMDSAQNWIRSLKKKEFSVPKWGSDVEKIAVALFLSDRTIFTGNSKERDEITYELSLGLLSRLAFCIDPRKFYDLDLVRELRKRTDAQNYTNPSVMLALCNAGESITAKDVEKLNAVFWTAHKQLWTDVQALSVLALACAAKQPQEVFKLQEISKLTTELKKKQYRNGTVENLKTTALVMQALFAAEHEADEENFDEEKALKQILLAQKEEGSFGNLVNTYYVLPVLNHKTLVNISSSHCIIPVTDEKDALKDLLNQVEKKWSLQYSLWIGNSRTIERTLSLNVPANISFYRIMEFAAGVDNKYRFEYSIRNGKPYIFSISDMQEDHENGMMWYLFEAVSNSEGEIKPIKKSPADVFPSDKQHLVFWYKCISWTL